MEIAGPSAGLWSSRGERPRNACEDGRGTGGSPEKVGTVPSADKPDKLFGRDLQRRGGEGLRPVIFCVGGSDTCVRGRLSQQALQVTQHGVRTYMLQTERCGGTMMWRERRVGGHRVHALGRHAEPGTCETVRKRPERGESSAGAAGSAGRTGCAGGAQRPLRQRDLEPMQGGEFKDLSGSDPRGCWE